MNERQTFFKLLKYSNQLKKSKKSLSNTDSEAFHVLLKFLATIEDNLHYSERQGYIELTKDFLDQKITAEEFSYGFMALYEGISQKLGRMKRLESLELANFLKPSRSELGELLSRIYGSCDCFSPDPEISISDEKELKDCAQILLSKLQEE